MPPFSLLPLLLLLPTVLSSGLTGPAFRSKPAQVNSNSVLVALLDSQYTEFSELVEKALLLPMLEDAVGRFNITILAPKNEALDRDLDPAFRRFILEPGNLRSLQTLLLSHVLPARIPANSWSNRRRKSLNPAHPVALPRSALVHPDAVVRPDGVIHGVDRLLVPLSVVEDFNHRRSLESIQAVLPEAAPVVDPRKRRNSPPVPAGAPPVLPIQYALAPGPDLAPAPAPGPGGPRGHFHGMHQVKSFIHTLIQYGGYNELADILVNLTSLATEMGRLVSEGYVITVLAPNDEAMGRLTAEQLSEPGAPEQIVYYHMIPEYQTEESMYNAVRRFGRVRYETLRFPHKVEAREADGSVKFGSGEGSAYLFDPDIYTDGRISVQGIDRVLFPPETAATTGRRKASVKGSTVPRRGRLMETACGVLAAFGQRSRFASCL